MTCPQDVGRVLLLRVHKTPPALLRPFWPLASDAWFCRWFQLTPPRGAPLRFPCYQWLEDKGSLVLREGTGEGDTGGRRGWCVGGNGVYIVQNNGPQLSLRIGNLLLPNEI